MTVSYYRVSLSVSSAEALSQAEQIQPVCEDLISFLIKLPQQEASHVTEEALSDCRLHHCVLCSSFMGFFFFVKVVHMKCSAPRILFSSPLSLFFI